MALTDYYVDPAINANSGTGTIGDPFGDLQYALNTVTRDATNGDRFNIKAGTAEVLAAAISLATYGTPTAAAPLVFQGYNSAAGDGGIGEINNGGANIGVYTAAANFIHWIDMAVGNTGTQQIVSVGTRSLLINCEFFGSSNFAAVQVGDYSHVVRCKFNSDITGTWSLRLGLAGSVYHCNFTKTSNSCLLSGGGSNIGSCIFILSGSASGIGNSLSGNFIMNNSLYGGATTGTGINLSSQLGVTVINNILSDFSGAGAEAVLISSSSFLLFGANAYYNNTTNISGTVAAVYEPANITLTNAPFTNPGAGDFSIATAAKAELQAQGWPSSFLGISTNQYLDPGAAQIQIPTVAGGGRRPRGRYHGI